MFFSDLLILLVFVWLSRKFFQAINLPPLFGEIFAGVIAGPLIFGLVAKTEAITVLAELGIFFLMFHSGLESSPKQLFGASKSAIFIALGNMLLSVLGGFFIAWLFNLNSFVAVFLGMNISITAVTICIRLFKDLKMGNSAVANTVMAAAVMTEVIVLASFSILLDLNEPGQFDMIGMLIDLIKFAAYFVIVFFVGHHYFPHLYRILYKGNKGFTFSLILALTLAVIAEAIGLHFIIGAFLAGLFLHQEIFDEAVYKKIEDRTFGMSYSFLAPIFFATLAFHLNFSALITMPLFIVTLIIVVLIAKFFGSAIPAYLSGMSRYESIGVGLAMNNRGAVDLIIASLALDAGLISTELFSVLIIASFTTTLVSILGMKPVVRMIKKSAH